jgi:hypothetical protein
VTCGKSCGRAGPGDNPRSVGLLLFEEEDESPFAGLLQVEAA